MSQPRRTLAQLRAEKEARLRTVEEGIRLRKELDQAFVDQRKHSFADRSDVQGQLAVLLEKATRACVLLEHGPFFDRANVYRHKGYLQEQVGQIGEALVTFREAQKLYALAATQVDANSWEVKQNSMVNLCNVAKLLQLHNQFAEAEKHFHEVLYTSGLHVSVRMQCVQALAVLNNQRENWSSGAQFCEEALTLLPGLPTSDKHLVTIHAYLLAMLGDAMEGQGEWARARQYDKQAFDQC